MRMWRRANRIDDLARRRIEDLHRRISQDGNRLTNADVEELVALEILRETEHKQRMLRARPLLVGIAVLLCSIFIGLSILRVRTTDFVSHIVAPAITLIPAPEMTFANIQLSTVTLSGASVTINGAMRDITQPDTFGYVKLDGKYRLESAVLPLGSILSIAVDDRSQKLHLHVECGESGACAGGRVEGTKLSATSKSFPAHFQFNIQGRSFDLTAQADSEARLLFDGIDISGFSFDDVSQVPTNARVTQSWNGVQSGDVTITSLDKTLPLEPGEWIYAVGPRLRLAKLIISDTTLTINIRGSATKIELARSGRLRDLRPTILESTVAQYEKMAKVIWGLLALSAFILLRGIGLISGRL